MTGHTTSSKTTSSRIDGSARLRVTHASRGDAIESAETTGRRFVQSRAFELLSRAGFVARGLIYAIIGLLALKLAVGSGGKLTNQQGALHTVAHQPFGRLLLMLMAVGLGSYALWRLVRAAIGHGPEGVDSRLDRLGALGSGIAYGAMCAVAVEILLGANRSGAAASPKKATAGVLGWPAGAWLVGCAGAALIAIGLYQGYLGVSQKFRDYSKTAEMGPATRKWFGWVGTIGYLARMLVFALIGIFLIKAAIDYNPRAAVGIDGALAHILHHTYGSIALAVVATGFLAFALYSLSDARYRKI